MDMLPLVPVLMLGAVCVWLMWPVIVDPIKAHMRAARRANLESAESLADGLFGVWREHAEKVGGVGSSPRG